MAKFTSRVTNPNGTTSVKISIRMEQATYYTWQSDMARYFTIRFYFHSPLAHENILSQFLKYFTISHSDSFNE